MKVILNADRSTKGQAALDWCRRNLCPGDEIIAVVGITGRSEFGFGIPSLSLLVDFTQVRDDVDHQCCEPLRAAGLQCEVRVVAAPPARGVLEVAEEEHADLIVVRKRPHSALVDTVLNETATQILHDPPCPVVVIPAAAHAPAVHC